VPYGTESNPVPYGTGHPLETKKAPTKAQKIQIILFLPSVRFTLSCPKYTLS